jgi:hypothetical protein
MSEEKTGSRDLIPLFIGITGHRDIRDEDKAVLKELIKNILNEKIKQCPDTPIVVLTPLAEGADRLAAWAALECGISFICPLPMPVDEYRNDFITPASLKEFNVLLGQSEAWFEIPLQEGTHREDLTKNKSKRDEQYYQIGFYVARYSQLLIALWDGVEQVKRGGTAHIVNLKKTGLPSEHPQLKQKLKNLQTGPIYHILTPRKTSKINGDLLRGKMIYPVSEGVDLPAAEAMDKRFLKHIDTYNQDVKRLETVLSENDLSPEQKMPGSIARFQMLTDLLATHFQTHRFFALKVLLVLTVVAFMFFQAYAEFWDKKPLLLLLYPLTMGIGALWFLNAHRRHYEQKHEDYRALSEACRVQYFLNHAKIKANVSEYYLQKHKGELEWVIYALRATLLKSALAEGWLNSIVSPDWKELNFINENWVKAQLDYYLKTGHKYERLHLIHRRMANRFFIGALSAAVILFAFSILTDYLPSFLEKHHEIFHSVLVVCTHSFLVISAALIGYNEKMVFSEQSKTCQQMVQLFRIAHDKLNSAIESQNLNDANDIIWELALESLMENADWLLLHRSRPMEIPKG